MSEWSFERTKDQGENTRANERTCIVERIGKRSHKQGQDHDFLYTTNSRSGQTVVDAMPDIKEYAVGRPSTDNGG